MIAKLYSYDFTTWYILNYGEMLLYSWNPYLCEYIERKKEKKEE